jgi:hypothetical protein
VYLWDLVGHSTSEGSLCSGLGDDLAAIMRTVEPLLIKRVGFAVRIVEATPRLSVFHLGVIHVPTGREWLGRRDIHGGIYWDASCRSIDPSVAYNLAASRDTGAIAS